MDEEKTFIICRGDVLTRLDPRFHQALKIYSKLVVSDGQPLKKVITGMFSGGTPNTQNPVYWQGSIPWISPKDFDEFELTSATDHISELALKESSSKLAPKGSVVLVVRSGVLLHTIPIAVTGAELAINQDVKAIICGDSILPHYLVVYFRVFQNWLLPVITKFGATVQSINTAELKNLKIPVPLLTKQSEVVAIYTNALAASKVQRERASMLLASIDDYLLAELGINLPYEPETLPPAESSAFSDGGCWGGRFDPLFHKPWYAKVNDALASCPYKKLRIRELCHRPVGGATPTRSDNDLYAQEGIKFVRIMNVGKDELILEDVKYIKQGVHEKELSRSQLSEDDILMTITGRVGTAAVVPQDILPANINQHIVRLRLRICDCYPKYLSLYLNCSLGHILSNRGVTGGTRIALDYPTISELQVPLPSKERQLIILFRVGKIRAEISKLRQQAEAELETAKHRIEAMLLGEEA